MKDKFTQLLTSIESAIYDQALGLQLGWRDGERLNTQYCLGYRAALLYMLGVARNVERGIHKEYTPLVYSAAATEFERFTRAFEEFAIAGKIKR